jgi:hypothetical protein
MGRVLVPTAKPRVLVPAMLRAATIASMRKPNA